MMCSGLLFCFIVVRRRVAIFIRLVFRLALAISRFLAIALVGVSMLGRIDRHRLLDTIVTVHLLSAQLAVVAVDGVVINIPVRATIVNRPCIRIDGGLRLACLSAWIVNMITWPVVLPVIACRMVAIVLGIVIALARLLVYPVIALAILVVVMIIEPVLLPVIACGMVAIVLGIVIALARLLVWEAWFLVIDRPDIPEGLDPGRRRVIVLLVPGG
jgi:hypothetical protein